MGPSMSTIKIALAASAALLTTACMSSTHNFGVGAGISTVGVNLEGKYAASNNIALRTSVNYVPSVDTDQTYDGVDYNVKGNMLNGGGFVDLYPFASGFHISGGAYAGDKSADLVGVPGPATTVDIGNTTYTGAQIGTLRGTVEYKDVAPFLGLGYDGFMNRGKLWSFNARAGVMFVGKPEVTLNAEGGLVSMLPSVRDELDREEQNLQDELNDYKYYPVVSLGVTRRF